MLWEPKIKGYLNVESLVIVGWSENDRQQHSLHLSARRRGRRRGGLGRGADNWSNRCADCDVTSGRRRSD